MAQKADDHHLAPSVQLWRQTIRLGLTVVADGRVYPTLGSSKDYAAPACAEAATTACTRPLLRHISMLVELLVADVSRR